MGKHKVPLPKIVKTIHIEKPLTVDRQVLHEMAVEYATETHREQGGVEPTWVVSDGQNISYIETPFENWQHKAHVRMIMATEVFPRLGVKLYSFVSEAYVWAGKITDENFEEEQKFVEEHGVSALPADRKDEVLIVTTNDKSDQTRFTRFLLTPRKKGPSLVGPRQDEGDMKMEGNLMELLRNAEK